MRESLKELARLDPESAAAARLKSDFDAYYSAAVAATRIMLGQQSGDAGAAIATMQKSSETFTTSLAQAQDAAIAEFRALLARGADNVERTIAVSLVMAVVMIVALGVGSWILIGSVFRSLGGEPEFAVSTVRSIAAGDFTTVVNLQPGDDKSLLHGI